MKPKIYLTEAEIEQAKDTLRNAGISSEKLLLMVSVLGSSTEKTYPHKYLATLLNQIVEETEAQLLFNYIPNQLEDAQQIFRYCKSKTQEHIFLNVFGKSLREFMGLTSQCDALFGNEGGAVNMAKALDVPSFAIFSPAVNKEDWSLFESEENVAVHLKDFQPDLFPEESKSTLKKRSAELYLEFTPEFISEKLSTFLKILPKEKKPEGKTT
ncbi:glycosyltransferase family 9 protein [Antarcticibacterium sp. 1MA-6-2]|uniref:glycosyltransferase family 9 protein n=1 Tax=Antarcticibacterium sp. 1MA-6-2 TaxID=2908210 RepID=UPI002883287F|nr:glycosyltransferase family 9 protein [Antarcticibacterium sp. 1MA-6-2]